MTALWLLLPEPLRRGLAWLAGGLAVAGALLLAVLRRDSRIRQEGRDQARRDALGQDLENRRTRDAVDRDVAREPDPADRLRDRWRRH